MAAFDVFISYPTNDGYSDFFDITEDVIESSLSSIKQSLESDDFDVGKITFDNLNLALRNEESLYSEASNASSIFPIKRDASIIKVEWNINSYTEACGNTPCGLTFLSTKRTVFKGLLEENSTIFDVLTQNVTFKVLGIDSIINKEPTPFASLDVNDTADELIFKILNQTNITQFFTVDALNINTKNNFVSDDISSLEGVNCLESLQEILKVGNSIMFVKDDVIFIKERISSATSQFVFYGASSNEGIENISKISKYGIGLNRTWNHWSWQGTSLTAFFTDSIAIYGERAKELSSKLITNSGKITTVLNSYLNEFGFPKTELTLLVPMYTPIVDLGFLDKINIDYPSEVLPSLEDEASKYGQAKYDSGFIYNKIINSLFISISTDWKILNKTIKAKKQMIEYKIREV